MLVPALVAHPQESFNMSDPSTKDLRQAALLAQALDGGPGHDWDNVDEEAREAVFALHPELAPAPRSNLLDDALSELTDGPLASPPTPKEQAEAEALAHALDHPEAALDPGLYDAVYALAPQRAPDPNVSIDEVLDSVSTGPFAPVILITGEFPAEIAPPTNLRDPISEDEDPSPVLSFAAHQQAGRSQPKPRPAARIKRWLPALGALAAAAATLLFVVPSISLQESAPEPPLSAAPAVDEVFAMAESRDEDESGASVPKAVSLAEPPTARPKQIDSGTAKQTPTARKRRSPPTRGRPAPAPEAAVVSAKPTRNVEPAATNRPDRQPSPGSTNTFEITAGGGSVGTTVAEAFATDDEALQKAFGASEGSTPDGVDVGIAPQTNPSATYERSTRSGRRSSATNEVADKSKPIPNVGLIDPTIYWQYPEAHGAWTDAHSLATRGDHAGAAARLLALAASASNPDVAIDAAIRAGRHLLTMGDLEGARSAWARSQSFSTARTALKLAREDLEATIHTVSEP